MKRDLIKTKTKLNHTIYIVCLLYILKMFQAIRVQYFHREVPI